MGFLLRWFLRPLVRSAPFVYKAARILVPIGATVVRAPVRYFKSIVNPRTGTQIVNRERGITVRDVTPLVRAGLQTRQIPRIVTRATVAVVTRIAPRVIKRQARLIIRDVLSPLYTSVQVYQVARVQRLFAGQTSRIERALDRSVKKIYDVTKPLKLNPTFGRTIRSYARIGGASALYYEGQKIIATGKEVYRQIRSDVVGKNFVPSPPPTPVKPETIHRPVTTIRTPPPPPSTIRTPSPVKSKPVGPVRVPPRPIKPVPMNR